MHLHIQYTISQILAQCTTAYECNVLSAYLFIYTYYLTNLAYHVFFKQQAG